MGLSTHMSFIWRFYKFDCQSLNRVRFGAIADLDCYLHQSFCLGLSQSLMGLVVKLYWFTSSELFNLMSLFLPTFVINRKFA